MFTNDLIEPETHRLWMERTVGHDDPNHWIIQHKDADVGVANLAEVDYKNRRCSWAFYLGDPEVPGPVGLAVEFEIMAIVFADMGFHKLISEVLAFNDRVIALHEHVGFVREGVLREHVHRSDGVHDVVVLSMLAPEWQERHGERRR